MNEPKRSRRRQEADRTELRPPPYVGRYAMAALVSGVSKLGLFEAFAHESDQSIPSGTRGGGRTHNLRLRRPTLYPIELLAHATGRTVSQFQPVGNCFVNRPLVEHQRASMARWFNFLHARFVQAATAVSLEVQGDVRITELLQGRSDSCGQAAFKQWWKFGGAHFYASKVRSK